MVENEHDIDVNVDLKKQHSNPQTKNEIGQFSSWLRELERVAITPLDICDLTQIYNVADKLQV